MWLQDKRVRQGFDSPTTPKGVTARRNRGLRGRSSLPGEGFDSPLLHNLTKFYSIMIDIKNLSVGDYVQICGGGPIVRITTIYGKEDRLVGETQKGVAICRVEDVVPIALSPEFLVRYGFFLNDEFGVYEFRCRAFRAIVDLREHQNRIQVEVTDPSLEGGGSLPPVYRARRWAFFTRTSTCFSIGKSKLGYIRLWRGLTSQSRIRDTVSQCLP